MPILLVSGSCYGCVLCGNLFKIVICTVNIAVFLAAVCTNSLAGTGSFKAGVPGKCFAADVANMIFVTVNAGCYFSTAMPLYRITSSSGTSCGRTAFTAGVWIPAPTERSADIASSNGNISGFSSI